jgi:hypothetical protein
VIFARVIVVTVFLAVGGTALAQSACSTDAQCADGNACNGNERCLGGFCAGGTPPNCNDNSACTLDQCDPTLGCQHAPVVNGTSCSDGNACNGAETCRNGSCTAGTPPSNGSSCNLGNPCTNGDFCETGVCRAGVIRPDGAGCGDGNTCNGNETCQAGVCTSGTPKPNGTTCGDGDPCNGVDLCQSGACVTGAVPPNGTPCSDGDVCNGAEVCQNQVCVMGTPPPNGTSCADSNLCDGSEKCESGICVNGRGLDCDDGNPCTNDSCGDAVGCIHTPRAVGAFCDDGNPCNGREKCQANAVCGPGTPLPNGTNCDDGNVCNGLETCSSGQCKAGTPFPEGSGCADGNVCNGFETCHNGFCTSGTPIECDDHNPCTADTCQASNGCKFTNLANGTACTDDENVCDGVKLCQSGVCSATQPLNCPAVCDPYAGCVTDTPIPGDALKLRDAGKRGIGLSARAHGSIVLSEPPARGGPIDPVVHGAVLHLRSQVDGFERRVRLPKENWSYLGAPETNRGYRFADRDNSAPIRSVLVKDGKVLKMNGAAMQLGPSLGADPKPVDVVLILGNHRYCMSFGGKTTFVDGKRFLASKAPAPQACP